MNDRNAGTEVIDADDVALQSATNRFSAVPVWVKSLAGLLLLSGLIALPTMVSSYWVRVATMVVMLAVLGQAWNIITGFVGYPAFGNVAFFGIGAYTLGLLRTHTDVSFSVALLAGGVVAAVFCALVAPPLMRVHGHYFALATIGFAEALRVLVPLATFLPTGAAGTVIVPGFAGRWLPFETSAYFWMLAVLVLCVATAVFIDRSRFGYALKAIRADQPAARCLGINILLYKSAAWAVSAMIFGFAGGIWATWIGVIDPGSAFSLQLAILYSVVALLGGLGSVAGPLLGAVLIGVVGEVIWSSFGLYHLLVMGMIVMIGTVLLPEGIAGLWRGASVRKRLHELREGRL